MPSPDYDAPVCEFRAPCAGPSCDGECMTDDERDDPFGTRCTCGAGDNRPPGAHNIHCADPDASARVIPSAKGDES